MNDEIVSESAQNLGEENRQERKSIKYTFTPFVKAQTEMSASLKLISIVLMIVGALLLVVYIVVGTMGMDELFYTNIIVLVGAVVLVLGILWFFLARQRVKTARDLEASNTVNEYEFFSDCVLVSGNKSGEKLGVTKINYGAVIKVKETKNFLFFYYPSRYSAYGVEKSALSREEYNTVLKLLSRPLVDNAQTLELSQCDGF